MQGNNSITASGQLEGKLAVDHELYGETFYVGTLLVKRASGNIDRLQVTVPGRTLEAAAGVELEKPITVIGQIRTYNKVVDGDGRLIVTLYVQSIAAAQANDSTNIVELSGFVCRQPTYRHTPFGREISDAMVVVSRGFGKDDHIPCIAWGRNAGWLARRKLGTHVHLTGRLQSREYEKLLPDGSYILRTAYEVSIFAIRELCDEEKEAQA